MSPSLPSPTGLDSYERLRRARLRLVEGDARGAIRLLERDPEPSPELRDQRVATLIGAHCALGQSAEAEAIASSLREHAPQSPLLTKLGEHQCW